MKDFYYKNTPGFSSHPSHFLHHGKKKTALSDQWLNLIQKKYLSMFCPDLPISESVEIPEDFFFSVSNDLQFHVVQW